MIIPVKIIENEIQRNRQIVCSAPIFDISRSNEHRGIIFPYNGVTFSIENCTTAFPFTIVEYGFCFWYKSTSSGFMFVSAWNFNIFVKKKTVHGYWRHVLKTFGVSAITRLSSLICGRRIIFKAKLEAGKGCNDYFSEKKINFSIIPIYEIFYSKLIVTGRISFSIQLAKLHFSLLASCRNILCLNL